ncbi:MAG: DUF6427 family protein [Prevotellaceae bacterium]|jgi:hypothetical protein|nr:DUF6427 family protein [Prevotellaceae bacterium]
MINYIQRNTFLTTVFTGLIILIALWLPDFLAPATSHPHLVTQPLQGWLLSAKWMSGASGLWVNLGLTVLTAALLFLSNLKHLFINVNDRLMLLLYLFLVSALPKSHYYPEAQIAAIAVIIGLYCLFQSYQKKAALAQLFLAAMWVSIAGLCYFPAIAVLLTVVINILITREFDWRDWTAFIVGFLCPYFYFGLYLFFSEDTILPLWQGLQQNFYPLSLPVIAHNLYEYIFVTTLAVIIIWIFLNQEYKGALNKIKIVHLRQTNNWLLVCVLISAVIFRPPYGSMMPLLAIPLSIIMANADNQLWRKKVYIFFLLLLITAIIGSQTV